jgi:hypothetical protein
MKAIGAKKTFEPCSVEINEQFSKTGDRELPYCLRCEC